MTKEKAKRCIILIKAFGGEAEWDNVLSIKGTIRIKKQPVGVGKYCDINYGQDFYVSTVARWNDMKDLKEYVKELSLCELIMSMLNTK